MKLVNVTVSAALLATLAACSKGGDNGSENETSAAASSGTESREAADNEIPGTAGSYPPAMNAAPGTGSTGSGATGVDPDAVANPPAPDTTGAGDGAGGGMGSGMGGPSGAGAGQ